MKNKDNLPIIRRNKASDPNTLAASLAEIVSNVKSFGAFGDGNSHTMSSLGYSTLAAAQVKYPTANSLDDEADWCAIQQALNSFGTVWDINSGSQQTIVGGCVYMPNGKYVVNNTIIIPPMINLVGQSESGTTILYSGSNWTSSSYVIKAVSWDDPTTHSPSASGANNSYRNDYLANFNIAPFSGNSVTSTTPSGILMTLHFKSKVYKVTGKYLNNFITLTNECNGVKLELCKADHCNRGFFLDNRSWGVNNCVLDNCYSTAGYYQGIFIYGALNTQIINCDFEFNGASSYNPTNISDPTLYYGGSVVCFGINVNAPTQATIKGSYLGHVWDGYVTQKGHITSFRSIGNITLYIEDCLMDGPIPTVNDTNRFDNFVLDKAMGLKTRHTNDKMIINPPYNGVLSMNSSSTFTWNSITNAIFPANHFAFSVTNNTAVVQDFIVCRFTTFFTDVLTNYYDIQKATAGIWIQGSASMNVSLAEYINSSYVKSTTKWTCPNNIQNLGHIAVSKNVDLTQYTQGAAFSLYLIVTVPANATIQLFAPAIVWGSTINPLKDYEKDYLKGTDETHVTETESTDAFCYSDYNNIVAVEVNRTGCAAGNLTLTYSARTVAIPLLQGQSQVDVLNNYSSFVTLIPRSKSTSGFKMNFTPTTSTGNKVTYVVKNQKMFDDEHTG